MKKVLVANRGEIACRVISSAQKLGIKAVAVYSDADKDALHVKMADEAVHIGDAPSKDSYLVIDKIIKAVKDTGAEGVHPGYGFLSENAEFAKRLDKEGITFIGPSVEAIVTMGSKLKAKEAVKDYNIPLVPGTDEAMTDIEEGKSVAREIGYPILIKASAGGGGKGMRKVWKEEDFEEQFQLATSEARSAFGDDSVFIEKYIESPRHIEIQILADNHGNVIHLNERECSIQRRHQKVIEEAPSAKVNDALRNKMGNDAIMVAKACNYRGAGTVEFIMDPSGHYYFLEMNTRLQVEHPITEMITGVDLVEQQIKIARGEILSITQDMIGIQGHAIELRVYAEDPKNNFLPSIGVLEQYQLPQSPGVRVDNGFSEGDEIPIYYDPMISKLVVHAENRHAAIQKMKQAISEYHIKGIENTLDFGAFVMDSEAFKQGNYDTHFVENDYKPEYLDSPQDIKEVASLLAIQHWKHYCKTIRN